MSQKGYSSEEIHKITLPYLVLCFLDSSSFSFLLFTHRPIGNEITVLNSLRSSSPYQEEGQAAGSAFGLILPRYMFTEKQKSFRP